MYTINHNVNCRIGSLEIKARLIIDRLVVNCRIGSLEKKIVIAK